MVECYYCRGDGGDPDCGRVLECPVCDGSGELDLLDGDDEYPEDEDEPAQPQETER